MNALAVEREQLDREREEMHASRDRHGGGVGAGAPGGDASSALVVSGQSNGAVSAADLEPGAKVRVDALFSPSRVRGMLAWDGCVCLCSMAPQFNASATLMILPASGWMTAVFCLGVAR